MCSLGDDNIEDLENLKFMPSRDTPIGFSKCNKCRDATPIVLLRSKDKYCKDCFISGTIHKFKSLLGKHKLIRPNDKVLVIHRCGHQTTSLLHFLRQGLDLETHKKLRFEPIILFLEDLTNFPVNERLEITRNVEKEVSNLNFSLYLISFSQLLKSGFNKTDLKLTADELELIDDEEILGSDVDFLGIKKREFLIEIANFLNCKFIFTPEISSDVASQLLTDVALGRGSHVALNTGFCDFRDETVKILRPLRVFDLKELAFYNYFNHLEPVTYRFINENPYKSIQGLVKKFVCDLQMNYPATVTTILKTGDKLTVNNEIVNKCRLCKAPIDDNNHNLTSSESTQFSHWVSTNKPDYTLTSQERYTKTLEAFNNLTSPNYCFTCAKLEKSNLNL